MTALLDTRPGLAVAKAPRAAARPVPISNPARILGVGTSVPEEVYTQRELLDILGIEDPKIRSLFLNSAIDTRHVVIPGAGPDGTRVPETQGRLLAKHREHAVTLGGRALSACLDDVGATLDDLEYLCCVTTTGYLTPGLSALIIRDLGIDPGCHRVDVVGMGCNAGLNALNGTSAWAAANPGRLAVMICAEVCSAAYVLDTTMRTAVVNSLFGDGAAAVAVRAPHDDEDLPVFGAESDADADADHGDPPRPYILSFASHIITDAVGAMRYDWDEDAHRFSFFLDPEIPYVVGANAERVVDRLLVGAGLRRGDVDHWLVHSGGKKVVDALRVNLGLTRHDVRHTTGVLRDYGNLSSGSFLFSYERLMRERVVRPGDIGVLMTMGPGSTIETALVRW